MKIIQSLKGKKSFHLYSLYKGYGYSEYFRHRKVNNPLSQLHMRKKILKLKTQKSGYWYLGMGFREVEDTLQRI